MTELTDTMADLSRVTHDGGDSPLAARLADIATDLADLIDDARPVLQGHDGLEGMIVLNDLNKAVMDCSVMVLRLVVIEAAQAVEVDDQEVTDG